MKLNRVLIVRNLDWVANNSARSGHSGIDTLPYDFLPASLSERRGVATILYDMDAEIIVLGHRLDKTRAVKQGMMEQSLNRVIRHSIPDAVSENEPGR